MFIIFRGKVGKQGTFKENKKPEDSFIISRIRNIIGQDSNINSRKSNKHSLLGMWLKRNNIARRLMDGKVTKTLC